MDVRNTQSVVLINNQDLRELQARLHGKAITGDLPEYDEARRIWNGGIDCRPALIVACSDPQDVVQAVRFARSHNLEIAVRGGGHSIPGYCNVDGGIVIDLSPMKDIQVDPQQRTALVPAGVTLAEFMQATQAYGLATTTGTASDTGVAGLTLGGGMGWLMSKFGLACDNVLSFEMVTAEGEVVHASAEENPDLYWGLRGGGGNFGIVTAFEFKLHPVSTVLAGMLIHPMAKAREVLQFYRDFAGQSPDELTVYGAMLTSPDGHPVVAILPCYFGDLKEGERILEPLRKFGPPLMDTIHPMSYYDMIHLIDESTPPGRKYYDKGGTLPQLSDPVIDRMVEAGASRTTPLSLVLIQHLHGAAARVPAADTAFSARIESYMPVFMAAWEEGPAEAHKEWSRKSWASMKPFAVEESYINFLTEEDQRSVPSAYGGNYPRLLELKRRWDPENVFHRNPNIRPE